MRKLYLAEKRWNENTRAQYSDMHEKGRKLWMAIATENIKVSNPDYPVPPENPFTASNKSLPPKDR